MLCFFFSFFPLSSFFLIYFFPPFGAHQFVFSLLLHLRKAESSISFRCLVLALESLCPLHGAPLPSEESDSEAAELMKTSGLSDAADAEAHAHNINDFTRTGTGEPNAGGGASGTGSSDRSGSSDSNSNPRPHSSNHQSSSARSPPPPQPTPAAGSGAYLSSAEVVPGWADSRYRHLLSFMLGPLRSPSLSVPSWSWLAARSAEPTPTCTPASLPMPIATATLSSPSSFSPVVSSPHGGCSCVCSTAKTVFPRLVSFYQLWLTQRATAAPPPPTFNIKSEERPSGSAATCGTELLADLQVCSLSMFRSLLI